MFLYQSGDFATLWLCNVRPVEIDRNMYILTFGRVFNFLTTLMEDTIAEKMARGQTVDLPALLHPPPADDLGDPVAWDPLGDPMDWDPETYDLSDWFLETTHKTVCKSYYQRYVLLSISLCYPNASVDRNKISLREKARKRMAR